MHIKKQLSALLASVMLVGVFAVPTTVSANPAPFCTKTASGLQSQYTFPDECSGSAFPTLYRNIRVNVLGQCTSTLNDVSPVHMWFNNDYSVGQYSYQTSFGSGHGSSGVQAMLVGEAPCKGAIGNKYAGSLAIKMFLGNNGDDYTVPWVARNAYQGLNAGAVNSEIYSTSGSWWNYNPNGPPVQRFTISLLYGNWTLGSQFTVSFE
jgi:hypothetical protein